MHFLLCYTRTPSSCRVQYFKLRSDFSHLKPYEILYHLFWPENTFCFMIVEAKSEEELQENISFIQISYRIDPSIGSLKQAYPFIFFIGKKVSLDGTQAVYNRRNDVLIPYGKGVKVWVIPE